MDLGERIRETREDIDKCTNNITELLGILEDTKAQIQDDFINISNNLQISNFDIEKVGDFWNQPYAIIPKKSDEWYVISPTFVDFQIGWLEKSVKGWNYFIVNKFMNWLSPLPDNLREKFNFKETMPIKVFDGVILTGSTHQDEAWKRYSAHLSGREGKDRIKIKKGHEFSLIANMIDDGILPFMPKPITNEDLRDSNVNLDLRPYQREAWDKLLELGAIGVYWPMGAGKTIIGIWSMSHLKGRKFVAVPTTTLKEQWESRIREYMPGYESEIDIITYQGYNKVKDNEYVLGIFDECHRLPANSFSKLATIKTKYRIGLSASPYREDGRTNYIFALTGFPVGMDWQEIIKMGIIGKPTVTIYILKDYRDKMAKIEELVKDDKKTIIYSYWLEFGDKVAKKLQVPFINGSTKKRLDILNEANISVVSSVGGEGVSLPDLERVIEAGFQYGSRREEAQLMGRLFHSKKSEPEHIILMTEDEIERYEKRLYSIYEKGFRVNVVR